MKVSFAKLSIIISSLSLVFLFSGCTGHVASPKVSSMSFEGITEKRPGSDRLIIRRASLTLEVSSICNSIMEINSIIEKTGGFVENKSIRGKESANLTLRVPSKNLTSIIDTLASLGDEKRRNISSEDVTEQYIDTEARLKNAIALRDRLKQLLSRAKDVKDILAIEKELTRIQSDIDSMEGRLKSLKGKIDFASINLYLEQKTILGPLGYVANGIGWFIKKLFVLR